MKEHGIGKKKEYILEKSWMKYIIYLAFILYVRQLLVQLYLYQEKLFS